MKHPKIISIKLHNPNKRHLHLNHLKTHNHEQSIHNPAHTYVQSSNYAPSRQESKTLSQREIQQRQKVVQYILDKQKVYSNKPRLWQITHSPYVQRRLLNKSHHIAELYSIPVEFVRECINDFFVNIDKHVLQLRKLLEYRGSSSFELNRLFKKDRTQNNQWRSSQLERAKQIFFNSNVEEFTENELLQKYCTYICETLTPSTHENDIRSFSELRNEPFDLDNAYAQAEQIGKEYLKHIFPNFEGQSIPNIKLIKEMIDLGFEHMKKRPKAQDFEMATSFLSKVSLFHQAKQAYESSLQNMGDDFMLLRFGKSFGAKAPRTSAQTNKQFIYLVHLFIQSFSRLVKMFSKTDEQDEDMIGIKSIIGNAVFKASDTSIITANDDLFSPLVNIDQWTWLLEKWRDALRTFPIMLTQVGAFSRLMRTTIGTGIARIYNFAETIITNNKMLSSTSMNEQLFQSLQMGFYFGIAYAIVDCTQDEIHNIDKNPMHHLLKLQSIDDDKEGLLKPAEMIEKWLLMMEEMLSGKDFPRVVLPKTPLTRLLLETFNSLIILTKNVDTTCTVFNELALLLRSQRTDKKVIGNSYSDEELLLGAMLKSHFTYTCAAYLGNIEPGGKENERMWIMPFLGQLTDDCRDFYDDLTSDSVTMFTHYALMDCHESSTDKHLLNPFFVFLNLCSWIYTSSGCDIQTGAFLGRRIARTLRSIEISSGESALREFLHLFCQNDSLLQEYFWKSVRPNFHRISDPEKSLFRKINRESIQYATTNRKLETYVADNLNLIEDTLEIHSFSQRSLSTMDYDEQLLISAMNYSVKAGGKRLRPLLMMMVSDLYKLNLKNVLPLACGIEYLHTSSLIFDDLPAQDNSDLRRGRPTLHKTIIDNDIPMSLCEGRAQLAAVDLIAVTIAVISHDLVKNGFSHEHVNRVVSEVSASMHDLCIGQMMDLRAARMDLNSGDEQLSLLDRIACLKTGKAIEIVLITPAILAQQLPILKSESIELTRLRELSRLMGILYQMRDDLLDVEGENIGKPTAIDVRNNTVTYVTVLGVEGTHARLKDIRRQTLELIDECWPAGAGTIKDVVNYFVDRKN